MRGQLHCLGLCLWWLCVACGVDTKPAPLERSGGSGRSGAGGEGAQRGDTAGDGGQQATGSDQGTGATVATGGDGPGSGGGDGTGSQPGADGCAVVCDDGIFCNGIEACEPGSVRADQNGCTRIPPACLRGQDCDEATRRCVTDCTVSPDADFDGHDAMECGGEDCDDSAVTTSPDSIELCNGVDDNCDGAVDNGLAVVACPLPGAVGACMAGSCHILSCVGSALDCDGRPENGCELTDGVRGDCQRVDCAGAIVALPSDLPSVDACQEAACNASVPSVTPAPDGESCGRNRECMGGICVDIPADNGNGNGNGNGAG